MANLIHSTEDVFTNYLRGRTYKIPEYQRGYKWSDKQIEQLLNDISEFDDKLDDDLFYCLQNITLYPSKSEIAERIISHPASSSSNICLTVPSISFVFVLVID